MYAGGGPTTLSILRNSQQSDNFEFLRDKFGQPKGFTYVEFIEVEAVQNALLLNESELHGRQLKVSAKRTNVLGMKQFQGRRPNPFYGFPPRRPYMPGPLSIRHMDMGVCF